MLKAIRYVQCSPALLKCSQLQQQLLAWILDSSVNAIDISQANLRPRVLTQIEADWLWNFLQKVYARNSLLDRAKFLAAMPATHKELLLSWSRSIANLAAQFQPTPQPWPFTRPPIPDKHWSALSELLAAFYERGLRGGLPYGPDGTPVATGGVTYADFVRAFKEAHRLSQDVNARGVCVLCGEHLGENPEVDHWLAKSHFPLLSVRQDNLLPICRICNSADNKGQKPVYSHSSFEDWFHPYLRPGCGAIQLKYELQELAVKCTAIEDDNASRVTNLDKLLNLTKRWTREFKAEHATQRGILYWRERHRLRQRQPRYTLQEVRNFIQDFEANLLPSEPCYEVHSLLATALRDEPHIAAWHAEIGSLQEQP